MSTRKTDIAIMLGTSLIVYALSWLSMSTWSFYSSDAALRYLQIHSLVEHQWQTLAIDYPAQVIDPDFRFVPYYSAYLVINNQIYLSLTPFFNLIASGFYALFGLSGLPIVPVVSGLLTALAIYRLAQLTDLPHPILPFLGTIWATPLIFYCLELWDHTLGAACATWVLYAVAQGVKTDRWSPLFWGGVLLGIGGCQRAEIYLFAVAVALSLWTITNYSWRFPLVAAVGGLAGAIPLWGAQYLWYGHPFGPVVAAWLFGYGKLDSYLAPPVRDFPRIIETSRLLTHVESGDAVSFAATILSVVGIIVIMLTITVKRRQKQRLLLLGLGLTLLGYMNFAWLGWHISLAGLLPTFPLLALSLLPLSSHPTTASAWMQPFIWRTALIFIGLMLLIWPVYGGLQWGTRYFLPIYPLFIYLAWDNYHTYPPTLPFKTTFRWMAIGLMLLTFGLQLIGIRQLFLEHYKYVPHIHNVSRIKTDFIVTNTSHFPSMVTTAHKRNFIYILDNETLNTVLDRLAKQGFKTVTILPKAGTPILTIPDTVGDTRLEPIGTGSYRFEPQ